MTTMHNPYATPAALHVSASLDEYIDPMEEESPNSSKDTQDSQKEGSTQGSQDQASPTNKEIEVEEEDKPLPPSLHRTLTEEMLWDDDCPYVFWVTIRIPIPEDPVDLVTTMFEHLETFMTHMLEADKHFTVFPHNLSEYKSTDDLPKPLEDLDHLLGEVDEWLEYFSGARPRACRGNTYTSVLLGF